MKIYNDEADVFYWNQRPLMPSPQRAVLCVKRLKRWWTRKYLNLKEGGSPNLFYQIYWTGLILQN